MTVDCNWCTLKTDKDNLYALMCLHAHEGDDAPLITVPMVIGFLNENGITNGIVPVAINALIDSASYEQFLCVAQGIPPARGVDGHFEFRTNTEDMKKKPLIREDGTVDYKNSLNLATISAGELLAVYIPPTEGTPGSDLAGNVISALPNGKDLPPMRGRGIVPGDDGISYFAEYNGHIVMDGSKVYIDKLYRVNGDLNIEVGNIRFDGDVEISGDVRSGLEIEAKGDVFIHGHVGACRITAGKSITIQKGVQGHGNCIIKATENVVCKFVENCEIYAGNDICADSVMNSILTANHQVLVTTKNGNVISSEVYGMAGVIVAEAGNTAGAPTLLRAGMPREYYTEAAELTKLIQEIDSKTNALNYHLEQIEKAESNDSRINETRMKIIRAKVSLASNRKEYATKLQELEAKLKDDSENSFVNVTGTVYDGVRVYIGAYPYLVDTTVREVTFRVHGGQVMETSLT